MFDLTGYPVPARVVDQALSELRDASDALGESTLTPVIGDAVLSLIHLLEVYREAGEGAGEAQPGHSTSESAQGTIEPDPADAAIEPTGGSGQASVIAAVGLVAEQLRSAAVTDGLMKSMQSLFRQVFGSVPAPFALLGVDQGPRFQIVMANESAAERLGTTLDDLVGRYIEGALPTEEIDHAITSCRQALTARQSIWTAGWFPTREGECQRMSITPVRDERGRVTHLVAFCQLREPGPASDFDAAIRIQEFLDALASRVSQRSLAGADTLTSREREVLSLFQTGVMSDRELAGELGVTPSTAKTHVRNILRKANLSDRRDLMALALAHRGLGGPARDGQH